MFDFNLYDNPKPLKIFLCRPDTHKAICELNGISEESCRLKLVGNNQYELSFEYLRYIDINGERIETNGYDKLLIDTELFVEKFGYFKLKYPPYTDDGSKEIKSITAHSIDCELENKELVNFKVNTGEKDSAEYLVTYDDGETESLLNEYTGLPYDYIVFYNTFPEQLAAFKSFVLGGGAIDDVTRNVTDATRIAKFMEMIKLIPRLFSKVVYDSTNDEHSLIEYMKIFYAQDGVTVEKIQYKLSVLCARIDELFTFYTKYRNQLSLLTLAIEKCNCNWSVGNIDSSLANKRFQFNVSENIYAFLTNDLASKTKAIVDFDRINRKINVVLIENLGNDSGVFLSKNSLINSVNITCNEEKLCTRYNVTGGNDIDLRYVNFGHSRIDNIDYYLSVRDDNGNLVYVSEELAEKYRQYKADIEIAREKYIEYTKQYNQLNQDIRAFKYRLPNDEVKNDWDTYRLDELEGLKTVYNNLLCTLKTLYNEDYGDRGYTNGEINENFMRTTEYWYDYYAYNQVLDQLDEAINCKLNDERYSEIDNEQIIAKIKAFETEWSLYGTVELENKIKSYIERMNVMIDGGSIVIQANTDYTPKTWSNLSVEEKKNYNSLEINYYYTEYYKVYSEYVSCKTYLDSLYPQLIQMESDLADVTEDRNDLLKYVTLEGYNRNRLADLVDLDTITSEIKYSFTATEIGIITSLYIDSNYSNENILTTSLDDSVSTVDVEKELLEDAEEELSKVSQPQLTITTSIDNLLAIPEFKGYNFDIYNYVMLEYYKDYYVKLRLYEIEFNPVMPEDEISVVFTNYINSASERSDLSYILQQSSGGGSSSGGSGGSSGGNFGESDYIDVTISNTMLAKLLNTEMFGSRVTDIVLNTINIKTLTARTATFKDLANGTTTIDGGCITTGVIKSDNYNGTSTTNSNGLKSYDIDNTTGSIIILKDPNNNNVSRNGTFNFGGGKLKWNGSALTVSGEITANSLTLGNGIDEVGTLPTGNVDPSTCTGFKVSQSGLLTASNAVIYGTIYASAGSFSGAVTASSLSTGGKTSAAIGDGAYIDKEGNFTAGANKVRILKDGTFNFNDTLKWITTGTPHLEVNGIVKAMNLIAGEKVNAGSDKDGVFINSNGDFFVGKSGTNIGNAPLRISHTGEITTVADSGAGYQYQNVLSGGALTFYRKNTADANYSLHGRIDAGIMNSTKTLELVTAPDTIFAFGKFANNDGTGGVTIHTQLDSTGKLTTNNIYISTQPYGLSVESSGNTAGIYFVGGGSGHEFLGVSSSRANINTTTLWFGNSNYETSIYSGNGVHVNGSATNFYATTAGSSDRRLKEKVSDLDKYENFYMQLKPLAYKFHDGLYGLPDEKTRWGYYAQDVLEAYSNSNIDVEDEIFVSVKDTELSENEKRYINDDTLYQLNYQNMIALNTHMTQKALIEIERLKAEIEQLKN